MPGRSTCGKKIACYFIDCGYGRCYGACCGISRACNGGTLPHSRPFITVNGQTYYGKTVMVNMQDMATSALASGDQAVMDAVNAMMTECGVSAK